MGGEYLNFLQNELPGLLDDFPLNITEKMIFQHDGAPAHFGHQVRQHSHGINDTDYLDILISHNLGNCKLNRSALIPF